MGNKVYAEGFGVICGLADLKIDFQSVDPVMLPDGKVAENKTTEVRVSMSLPLAKDLLKRLNQTIIAYENQFGAILDLEAIQNNASTENQ